MEGLETCNFQFNLLSKQLLNGLTQVILDDFTGEGTVNQFKQSNLGWN